MTIDPSSSRHAFFTTKTHRPCTQVAWLMVLTSRANNLLFATWSCALRCDLMTDCPPQARNSFITELQPEQLFAWSFACYFAVRDRGASYPRPTINYANLCNKVLGSRRWSDPFSIKTSMYFSKAVGPESTGVGPTMRWTFQCSSTTNRSRKLILCGLKTNHMANHHICTFTQKLVVVVVVVGGGRR